MTDVARALWDLLNLAMVPRWNGYPIVGLAELAVAGSALLLLSRKPSVPVPKQPAVHTPGWIARHRARSGLRHPKAGAAIGYASALHQVRLSQRELDLGGLILGTKGSGKTYAWRC